MEFENKEIIEQSRKYFSKLGGIYFIGSVAIFVIHFIVFSIVQKVASQMLYNYDAVLFISSMSMYLLAFPIIIVLVRELPSVEIQQKKMSVGKFGTAFLMGYTLIYLLNLLGVFLAFGLGNVIGKPIGNPFEENARNMSLLMAVLLFVFCAPMVEEYIFRKIIIDRTVRYGEKTAIVLSGVMFALFHGNLNQFVYALGLGWFLGFIYVKTGRLIYTIMLHALVNFMGSIPGLMLMKLEQLMDFRMQIILYVLYLIFVLVMVIAGIVFWAMHFKKLKCVPGTVDIAKGQRFRTVFWNAGMVLYSVFWIVQIVQQIFAV